jgi:creatinine amidohydrolase
VQLPTVPIGCSAEHLDFPGTLHLRSATLGAILLDIAATCRQHGYRRLFVFTAHGGNYGPLADWLLPLRAACAPLELVLFLDSARLTAACHAASAAYGVSAEDSGHHAGEFETSILQELWPESVASTQLQAGLVRPLPTPSDIFYPSLRPHSESGTVGDPRAAGLGRAEHYLAVWVDILLDAYRTATGA